MEVCTLRTKELIEGNEYEIKRPGMKRATYVGPAGSLLLFKGHSVRMPGLTHDMHLTPREVIRPWSEVEAEREKRRQAQARIEGNRQRLTMLLVSRGALPTEIGTEYTRPYRILVSETWERCKIDMCVPELARLLGFTEVPQYDQARVVPDLKPPEGQHRCTCGYGPTSATDLEEHITAASRSDGEPHFEAR
jgi:hypothetical protein